MGKELLRGWFKVKKGDDDKSYCIARAFDEQDARREFGSFAELREIEQLKWAELSRLTGCVIPSCFNADDWALGNLMLARSGYFVIFCSKP